MRNRLLDRLLAYGSAGAGLLALGVIFLVDNFVGFWVVFTLLMAPPIVAVALGNAAIRRLRSQPLARVRGQLIAARCGRAAGSVLIPLWFLFLLLHLWFGTSS